MNACCGCRKRMTWAAVRVQWGRLIRNGMNREAATAVGPICQQCATVIVGFLKQKVS